MGRLIQLVSLPCRRTSSIAVLGFLGYGNPAGPFWFVGIEERGVGDDATLWRELLVRADHFAPIEDLKRAQENDAFASNFNVGQHVPTWLIMSKIVLRLNGEPDWSDHGRARQYQADRLGRDDEETFLADVLPLPAGNVDHWPYPRLFPTKDIYREKVLPGRLAALRQLIDQHRPATVFCYGTSYWDQYRQIFPDVRDYQNVGNGFARLGRTPVGTLVALTPFFSPYLMGHVRIDELARAIREDRFTWHDEDIDVVWPHEPREPDNPSS